MLAFHAARRLRAGAIVQALDALRPAHSSAAAATRATTVTWNTAAADALDAALLRPSSSTTTTAAAWSASADAAAVPPPPPPPEDAGPPSSSSSSTTTATSSTPAAAAAADDDDEDAAAAALTPRAVVEHLDRHIVGQAAAKRAVANALRARWRRHRVRPAAMREEIVPKNILMIGPTGTGKTEIARRLAKLSGAPFIKVEATKYTEVGFHGRDVEDIIRGLLDNAILLAKDKARARARAAVASAVEDRLLAALCGEAAGAATIESFRSLYRSGALDDRRVVLDLPVGLGGGGGGGGGRGPGSAGPPAGLLPLGPGGATINLADAPGAAAAMAEVIARVDRLVGGGGGGRGGGGLGGGGPSSGRTERRELTIGEARPLVEEMEADRLVSPEAVVRDAIASTEADGIVFIDEVDKIVVNQDLRYGADASSEGVQRDLLPLIEGSVVQTKHGNVKTDHILFIASGAFHSCRPSDMLAELQGRLPIRVELKGLDEADFYRILTEPTWSLLEQQRALFAAEGVDLEFEDGAVRAVARIAAEVNTNVENIGARRLHTVLERVLEEVSFDAPETAAAAAGSGGGGGGGGVAAAPRARVVIDADMVRSRLADLLEKQDLSRFVL